jgi:hypothetical protein
MNTNGIGVVVLPNCELVRERQTGDGNDRCYAEEAFGERSKQPMSQNPDDMAIGAMYQAPPEDFLLCASMYFRSRVLMVV